MPDDADALRLVALLLEPRTLAAWVVGMQMSAPEPWLRRRGGVIVTVFVARGVDGAVLTVARAPSVGSLSPLLLLLVLVCGEEDCC